MCNKQRSLEVPGTDGKRHGPTDSSRFGFILLTKKQQDLGVGLDQSCRGRLHGLPLQRNLVVPPLHQGSRASPAPPLFGLNR